MGCCLGSSCSDFLLYGIKQKRGYRYVMSYRVGGAGRELDGIRLIGSHDGIHWDEAGDQWWFYYMGFNEGHQSKTRTGGLGLATLRKEGLISLHGPESGGGVIVTRKILWPGVLRRRPDEDMVGSEEAGRPP